jgi:hypothetical protein
MNSFLVTWKKNGVLKNIYIRKFQTGKKFSIIPRQMEEQNSSFFVSHNRGGIGQETYHFPA